MSLARLISTRLVVSSPSGKFLLFFFSLLLFSNWLNSTGHCLNATSINPTRLEFPQLKTFAARGGFFSKMSGSFFFGSFFFSLNARL